MRLTAVTRGRLATRASSAGCPERTCPLVPGGTRTTLNGVARAGKPGSAHVPSRALWSPDRCATRLLDLVVSASLLVALLPLIGCIATAIKLSSRGPVFYRCRRVGFLGHELGVLKLRKMHHGASGPPLTLARDGRFTRVGAFLAATKLDEIPQLWNVVKGEMSLVGPRPEDARFVRLHEPEFVQILGVKPGITGLCQLAFARESEILDPTDRLGYYVERLLPQKVALDLLYATRRSVLMDVRILLWTTVPVLFRREVAVHRQTGRLGYRRRPRVDQEYDAAETSRVLTRRAV